MIGPISSSNTKSIPLAGSRCGQRVISLPFEFELGRVTYFRQCHLGRNKCFISKSRHSNALCTSTCSLVLSPLSSVQSLSRVRLFATPWTAAHTASLSITDSQSFLKLMSTVSVMSSNHLTHCHPLLLLPSIFPSIRVFSNESVLHIRWPKYWSFSFFPGKMSLYSLFFITASQLYHAISSHSKTTLFNFFQYRKLTLCFGFFLFFAALEVYTKTYCTSTCITGRIIHRSELARLTKAKDLGHQFYQERKGEEMEKEGVCVCVCIDKQVEG